MAVRRPLLRVSALGGARSVSNVRIEVAPLGGSPLSRLAQQSQAPGDWYAPRPRSADEWRSRAEKVRESASTNWRSTLGGALGNSSGTAAQRLARAADGGVVVTTGQQPGLFGGPV